MEQENASRATAYYTLVGKKDKEGIKKYLHTDVSLVSPLSTVKGKQAVLDAVSGFMNGIKSLKIRSTFGSKTQAMVVYDTDIIGCAHNVPAASLITFQDDLMIRFELFFDTQPFQDA